MFEKDPARDALVVDDVGAGRPLVCARCQREITTTSARIEVLGRHEHDCENPHGHRYRVQCFATAQGCTVASNPTSYWSWFPGYLWQIEHCGGCDEHLGWQFTRPDHSFHGFIRDRLIEAHI